VRLAIPRRVPDRRSRGDAMTARGWLTLYGLLALAYAAALTMAVPS
jgi:hypothetical protein